MNKIVVALLALAVVACKRDFPADEGEVVNVACLGQVENRTAVVNGRMTRYNNGKSASVEYINQNGSSEFIRMNENDDTWVCAERVVVEDNGNVQ